MARLRWRSRLGRTTLVPDRIGPASSGHARPAERLLPAAIRAGRTAGVTRLADLTRLDRLGLPVWQATRPLGRALSVHQGKGCSDAEARLGALLEAIESDLAERYVGDGPLAPATALPSDEGPARLGDFALDGRTPPDMPLRWARAEDLRGGAFLVPEDVVSLDLARDTDGPFDRGSGGLASGADPDDATVAGLCELIERDAAMEWRAAGPIAAMRTTLDPETIPFGWFAMWRDRLADANIALSCHGVPSATRTPVFACALRDRTRPASAYRAIHGTGCHPDAEIALFRALAEAIQSRATFISGARDDLLPADYAAPADGEIVVAFALPPPDGGRRWEDDGAPARGDPDRLVGALADAGFDRIGRIILGRPEGLCVARMIVPGLGSLERRRRRRAA